MNIGFIAFGNAKGYDSKQSGILKASELSKKIYTTSIQDLFKEKIPDGKQGDIVKIRFTKDAQGTISNDMTMYCAAIENNPPRPKFLGASIGISGAFLNPLEAKRYLDTIISKLYSQTNERGQFSRDSVDWNQVDLPKIDHESLKKVSRSVTHRDFSSRHALVVKVNDFVSDFGKIMKRFYDYGGMQQYTDVYLVRDANMFVSLKQAADRSQGEIAQFKGQARFIGSINDFSDVMLSVMSSSLKSGLKNRDDKINALEEKINGLLSSSRAGGGELSNTVIKHFEANKYVAQYYRENHEGLDRINNFGKADQALRIVFHQLNNKFGGDETDDSVDSKKSNLSKFIISAIIGFAMGLTIWGVWELIDGFSSNKEVKTPPPAKVDPEKKEQIDSVSKEIEILSDSIEILSDSIDTVALKISEIEEKIESATSKKGETQLEKDIEALELSKEGLKTKVEEFESEREVLEEQKERLENE